jgi:hypothetical protein
VPPIRATLRRLMVRSGVIRLLAWFGDAWRTGGGRCPRCGPESNLRRREGWASLLHHCAVAPEVPPRGQLARKPRSSFSVSSRSRHRAATNWLPEAQTPRGGTCQSFLGGRHQQGIQGSEKSCRLR